MTYPTRTGMRPLPQANSQDEKAKLLTGMNGTDPDKLAVTRGDVGKLGLIALKSTHVSSAPTAADHNALVDDVRAIAALLTQMGATFTGL